MPPKVVEASPKGTLEALLIGYTYAKVVTVPTDRHLTYARLLRALCIRLSFSPFFPVY
jgi:hypothetical protein